MKIFFTLILSIYITGAAFAQAPPKGRQRLEAAKIAFITQRLNLTTEEAKDFWPLYNTYQKEAEVLIRQRALGRKSSNDFDSELDFKTKMLDMQKRYGQQFRKVLPSHKASEVFKAERDFRQNLIKELGERRKQGLAVKN